MTEGSERRQFARICLELPASIIICQLNFQSTGTTADLSLGGCYLHLTHDLAAGTACRIKLSAGEGFATESVDLAGVIVRCDGPGVGIRFTDLTEENRDCLARIVDRAGAARPVN